MRGAVVVGVLLLLAGFAVGVAPRSVDDAGQQTRCGTVLIADGPVDSSRAGARSATLCADTITAARRLTWGLITGGLLIALAGRTAGRESRPIEAAHIRAA